MVELKCKICGIKIKGCTSCYKKVHSWKNTACCPEHYQEYIRRVMKARGEDIDV